MIDPQVEHGGASSWFWIAANVDREGLEADEGVEGAFAVAATSSASCSGVVVTSSRLFTPARNCASGDRNFAAIQRKM
jgi:hypothetical protein